MGKGLVVIEAPGKVARLTALLRRLGLGWRVMATRGHFVRSPASLWPLAITSEYEETARRPVARIERELRASARGRSVFIATDDDAEGDVIARDVADAVRSEASQVARVRLTALSAEAVRRAFAAPEPMDARNARHGDARRILDRLIGHTFSRKGAPAGRILTPLLASMRRYAPASGVVRLVVPAADGGPPWRTEVTFTAPERDVWVARLRELQRVPGIEMSIEGRLAPQSAWGYNELIRALCGRGNAIRVASEGELPCE